MADISVRPYLQRGELVNVLPELNFKAWQLYIFRPHQPLLPARTSLYCLPAPVWSLIC
ncbi:hypothetical protein AB6870_22465 [Rahnella inusitata]|uniref:hypothetical protein n=1 Tax=Rahnella inusitata TaxID=58169 RepID=UPI0039BECFD1